MKANPTTGRVLVHFDDARTDHEQVLAVLDDLGFPPARTFGRSDPERIITTLVLRSAVEFALKQFVLA